MNRSLTDSEMQLVRWMLKHGTPEARDYLAQVADARVTPWRCDCGCASFKLAIGDRAEPRGGLKVLADFLCGSHDVPDGIFVYEQEGVLSGVEVYGRGGEAPRVVPSIETVRRWEKGMSP
jgi:hypothetical protein